MISLCFILAEQVKELIKFDEIKKTWLEIARHEDGNIAPNFQVELYKKMLDIFQPGQYYYYIVNIANVKIEYVNEGGVGHCRGTTRKVQHRIYF